MELNQVRYFLALAELRNFTWAAKHCNVTQPALTKAVQKLELELGGALIHRERRLTQLTDLGKLVLPMFERTLAAADAVRQHAEEFRRKKVAPLKIGLSPCVSATLAMAPLAELAERMPGLQVELVEARKDQLPQLLLEGAVNVALVGDPGFLPDRIDRWRLFEERILVVAPAWSPIADLQAVPLGALADAVWLDRPACDVTQRFLQAHFPPGRLPRVGPRAWKDAHVQDLVLAGPWIAKPRTPFPHPEPDRPTDPGGPPPPRGRAPRSGRPALLAGGGGLREGGAGLGLGDKDRADVGASVSGQRTARSRLRSSGPGPQVGGVEP